ncbi:MAG: AAA family ATPase [Betaproteobacteria bacterium]|nr:AAA family ATPase [Betaproteobacteria bacterium]
MLLYLIRGIPGSGKSTLQKNWGRDHFETDMWFEQNGGYDRAKIKVAHEWCKSHARAALEAGRDVVVSNTFLKRWEMQFYLDTANHVGAVVQEITMQGRWQNTHGIPIEQVLEMEKYFEK